MKFVDTFVEEFSINHLIHQIQQLILIHKIIILIDLSHVFKS